MATNKRRRLDERTEFWYRSLTDTGGHVNAASVLEHVLEDINLDPSLVDAEGAAQESLERVDRSFTYAANTAAAGATTQGTQLPMYDPDAYLALGEGDRVQLCAATRPDIIAWLAIQTENHEHQTSAYLRKVQAARAWLAHLPDDLTPLGRI